MKQRKVWLHQFNDTEFAAFFYTDKPSRRLRQLMCAYVTGRGLKGLTKDLSKANLRPPALLLTKRRILSHTEVKPGRLTVGRIKRNVTLTGRITPKSGRR